MDRPVIVIRDAARPTSCAPATRVRPGPYRTAAFIRQVLDAGSYVLCHDTLTYGDFPEYGPAICRDLSMRTVTRAGSC